MRVINRILFLLFALGLLAVGAVLAMFNTWRTERIHTLAAASDIAQVDNGPVEFAQEGNGPFLLVSHGTPGGYDQALALARPFREAGFQIIAPSRPGYLRTPLDVGLTPEDQADAFAALLTDLGIDKTLVVGFSSGAPAALQFALRYPARTRGILLLSPIILPFTPPTDPAAGGLLGRFLHKDGLPDLATWMLFKAASKDPKRALSFFLQSDSTSPQEAQKTTDFVLKNPWQLEWFRAMVDSYAPMTPRLDGLRNDLVQLRTLQNIPFESIKAPVLIVHGENDADVAEESLKKILQKVPQLQIEKVADAGQLVFLGPNGDAAREASIRFLQANMP